MITVPTILKRRLPLARGQVVANEIPETGFELYNNELISVSGTKTWLDNDDKLKTRPQVISVTYIDPMKKWCRDYRR